MAAFKCKMCGGDLNIIENRRKLSAVDRFHSFVRRQILHIFNTVLTEYERPVRFRVGRVFVQYLFVYPCRFVELIVPAEMIRTVVEIRPSVVIELRQSLL